MLDIMIVLGCVNQCLDATALRQLTRITEAMLSMTGRVTMLGISRWAGPGGSYRTVQRFFHTSLHWCGLQWALIRCHLLEKDEVIFVGGDDVVTTKSGKNTYGLDRFFSSLYGKPVPGLCFLCVSLISVTRRTSYPVFMEQHDETLKEKAPEEPTKKATTTRGRPKGSKNQHRRDVELSPYLLFVQAALKRLLGVIGIASRPPIFSLMAPLATTMRCKW